MTMPTPADLAHKFAPIALAATSPAETDAPDHDGDDYPTVQEYENRPLQMPASLRLLDEGLEEFGRLVVVPIATAVYNAFIRWDGNRRAAAIARATR